MKRIGWRWRFKGEKKWEYTETDEWLHKVEQADGTEIQELYVREEIDLLFEQQVHDLTKGK